MKECYYETTKGNINHSAWIHLFIILYYFFVYSEFHFVISSEQIQYMWQIEYWTIITDQVGSKPILAKLLNVLWGEFINIIKQFIWYND